MTDSQDLRKKAEALINSSGTAFTDMSGTDIQKMLYELQARQIELELQNEELNHSQHELMISRDRYARLYNSSPIGFLTLDTTGIIKRANPAAAKLLNSTIEGLENIALGKLINPLDQDEYYFFIRKILVNHSEQALSARLNIISNTHSEFFCQGTKYFDCPPENCIHNDLAIYVECRGHYNIDENNDERICLSIFDITATKNAHATIACLNHKLEEKVFQQNQDLIETNKELVTRIEELKLYKRQKIEQEAMINAIFTAAVEGIITVHLSGDIVYVNNTVESILGYSKEDLVNCNINKLIPLGRQNNPTQYLNNISGIGLSNAIGEIQEVTGIRKDGSTVPLDISIAEFAMSGTRYLSIIIRDITLRKLQEQSDQKHLDELAHVTRLGLMGELASGIAHEVNQPLTAISAYSQACLTLIENKNYDQTLLAETLHKTSTQALKAGQIIHRMRDFVKSKKIHRSTIDINSLINDAIGLCESYFKLNSITLQLQLKHPIPSLCIDAIQIEQVILNLIKNSIEALTNVQPSTLRKLSIQTAINENNAIEIRVKDNGPGINLTEQNKILTPFYTTKSEGMGMGLSICRSIIEAHKGTLRFNSEPGKGSTFYFTLPIEQINNGT